MFAPAVSSAWIAVPTREHLSHSLLQDLIQVYRVRLPRDTRDTLTPWLTRVRSELS